MSDIESVNYSEAAGGNNAASPNGAPEGMAPSGVDDTIREIMAAIKRDWNRSHPTVTSGGTANAQTLTYGIAPAGYFQGQRFSFIAGFTNTGAATLNVNGIGAKNIFMDGVALVGGEVVAGQCDSWAVRPGIPTIGGELGNERWSVGEISAAGDAGAIGLAGADRRGRAHGCRSTACRPGTVAE